MIIPSFDNILNPCVRASFFGFHVEFEGITWLIDSKWLELFLDEKQRCAWWFSALAHGHKCGFNMKSRSRQSVNLMLPRTIRIQPPPFPRNNCFFAPHLPCVCTPRYPRRYPSPRSANPPSLRGRSAELPSLPGRFLVELHPWNMYENHSGSSFKA